jgi:predicted lipoprotein with Yx(FWY)xxD motif
MKLLKSKPLLTLSIICISSVLMSSAHANPTSASPAPLTLTTETKNDEGERLLADIFGKTLYVFDLDQNAPAPVCDGDCLESWPPYLLLPTEAQGLQAPFGAVARRSKRLQLTYNSRPVYTYAYDRKLGDDKGDGLGRVWHYITLGR